MQKPPDPAKLPGGVHNWLPTSDALKTHGVWNSSLCLNEKKEETVKRSIFDDVKPQPARFGGCKKCGLSGHLTSQCTNTEGLIPEPLPKVKREKLTGLKRKR